MKTNSRQFSGLAAALTVSLAAMMAPASADEPTAIPFSTPPDSMYTNPCTGEEMIPFEIVGTTYFHFGHKNNFVARSERTGFTDDGYTLFSGHEHFVDNGHAENWFLQDLWRHDDNGSMFEVSFRFVINLNTGEAKVEEPFEFVCIRTV